MQAVASTRRSHAASSADVSTGRLPDTLETLATRTETAATGTLYNAGDVADAWYRLESGVACEYVQTADGQRQIVEFLLPGDLFGFCSRSRRESSVEIISDGAVLARYPRRKAEELASADAEVAREVRQRAFQWIARLQTRTLLLARTSALEKVSGFPLEMARRTSVSASGELVLPMSRLDIADYLAMAVETVSRALTTLQLRGAIALVNSRQVRIIGPQFLCDSIGTPPYGTAAAPRPTCAPPSVPGRPAKMRTSCS